MVLNHNKLLQMKTINISLIIVSNSSDSHLFIHLKNTIQSAIESCRNTPINLSIFCSEKKTTNLENIYLKLVIMYP